MKPGYKQTEVGVIPKDWKVDAIGDAFDISGGLSSSRDQLSANGYCYLHYGDIHKSKKSIIDVRSEYLDIPKLDVPLSRVPSRSLLADGDVVFVDASEDDEGTSKHLVVVNPEAIPYISGLHTIVVRSKAQSFDNAYKRYCFQTHELRRQFHFYAVGTKVSGISKNNIKRVFIPRPPLPEQRAIAGALSDVDALIGALDKLIIKKRDLKQATMQQLLTGQTRLQGFNAEWKVMRLGELIEQIGDGGTPSTADPLNFGGSIHWVVIDDIKDEITTTRTKLTERGLKSCAAKLWQPGTLILSTGATIGEVGIARVPVATKQGICGLVVDQAKANTEFLKYWLTQNKPLLMSKAQGTSIREVRAPTLVKFDIRLPRVPEQNAIATVLTDMGTEIVALEARLSKTRALKQGMIQDLLTGRIRLV